MRHPAIRRSALLALCWILGRAFAEVDSDIELQRLAALNTRACGALPDAAQTQFIVGYGSLMQTASRERTAPLAGPAIPVRLSGFRRGWFASGQQPGFNTTFLGAIPEQGRTMNAVLFALPSASVRDMDERESFYCRALISPDDIQPTVPKEPLPAGQYWIYLNGPHTVARPSRETPLVQSYVDIFIGGCLSMEKSAGVAGFAAECIRSTTDWSAHWVNDRLYPRRPFIYQPQAQAIDQLLKRELPDLFDRIRIE
jgi:hypothetical protein